MNENKNNMFTSFVEGLKSLSLAIIGILFVGILIGCLVAPIFSPWIRSHLMHNSDGSFVGLTNLPDVENKMVLVNIILWIIAIIAWSALIYTNIDFANHGITYNGSGN